MGSGYSAPRARAFDDPLSKVGKHADLRTTLLTAEERAELVERSMGFITNPKTATVSRQSSANVPEIAGNFQPPLAGCVAGSDWNGFVEETWASDKRVVFHTIIMPPGRNPKELTLYKACVLSDKRYKLEKGELRRE